MRFIMRTGPTGAFFYACRFRWNGLQALQAFILTLDREAGVYHPQNRLKGRF
jgi:hypothetical protein